MKPRHKALMKCSDLMISDLNRNPGLDSSLPLLPLRAPWFLLLGLNNVVLADMNSSLAGSYRANMLYEERTFGVAPK